MKTKNSFNQLYRHWDKDDNLLYIGISYNGVSRLKQHSRSARWFEHIARVTIENFDSREDVEKAEKEAIIREKPIYNIVHNNPKVVNGVKELRWSKPKYKVKGKRWLPPEVREIYLKFIAGVKEGVYVYEMEREDFRVLGRYLNTYGSIPWDKDRHSEGNVAVHFEHSLVTTVGTGHWDKRFIDLLVEAVKVGNFYLKDVTYRHPTTNLIVRYNWY